MHLEHISIKNFRLFDSLELKLNPGLNVLVGENDSSKTALIDAIRYTLGNNSSETAYIEESDFYKESNNLSIQLKFVDVDDYAHIFLEHLSYEINQDNQKSQRSALYVQLSTDKTSKEKRGYPYIKIEIRSGKNGNGLILESEIRQFLATTYLKPLRDAESEMSAGKRSRLSQILSSSRGCIQ